MLNVQRTRGASQFDDEVAYTRKWMWTHMILGATMVALFLFQELFAWFGWTAAWYAVSLAAMYGFMIEHQSCRVVLALLLLGGVGAGVFFINRVFPALPPPRVPLVPQVLVPIIVGLTSITYAVTALCLLFSARIRKAGQVGFSLW